MVVKIIKPIKAMKTNKFGVFFQSINQFKKVMPVQWITSSLHIINPSSTIFKTFLIRLNNNPMVMMATCLKLELISLAMTQEQQL